MLCWRFLSAPNLGLIPVNLLAVGNLENAVLVFHRRWSRQRSKPPEFHKRYLPKIDSKKLDLYREECMPSAAFKHIAPEKVNPDKEIP